jgi:2-polyprenyl-3-methyl-5-hydroxy-6-metoxy-1,4-benzoquinol methylase
MSNYCFSFIGCLQTDQKTQYRKQMADHFAAAVQDVMKREWSWLKESISILDLGCGFGMNAAALAQGGHTATAVDISKSMMENIRLESWKKQVYNDSMCCIHP